MKKLTVSLVALAAALVSISAARADTTPGWYAAAGVGVMFPENPTIYAGTKHSTRAEDANAAFEGSGGYAFDYGLRLEGEFLHNQMNMKRIDGLLADGHLSNNALFVNALYDFNTDTMLTPYVGAGIGPDFVHVKNVGLSGAHLDGDTVVAAYQAIVGVAAQLDPNWAVTADYRYVGSFDPKVDYSTGGEGRMSNASHNLMVGVRYSFAEPAPVAEVPPPAIAPREVQAPPVKVPPAPPKAVVAPVEENFTVFFDFDKSTLTPEAKRIIAAAAEKYKSGGFARIIVIGHTDTVGTKSYNQKLSERRAHAVKEELSALGIGTANVKEKGVGEAGLLVPTTQGVREAQNRRAEIDLVTK